MTKYYTRKDIDKGLHAIGGLWGVDLHMDVEDVIAAVAEDIWKRGYEAAQKDFIAGMGELLR